MNNYIHTYVYTLCIVICIVISIIMLIICMSLGVPELMRQRAGRTGVHRGRRAARHLPATLKHGWSKDGFSRIPSYPNMAIVNMFAICYLSVF